MKMVVAYIRHEAFEPIREELLEAGFPSLTISEVKGSGRQKAITEHYRGSELAVHLRPKLKLECVVEDKDVGLIKETVLRYARTGNVGDGKLFVLACRGRGPDSHRRGGRGSPPGPRDRRDTCGGLAPPQAGGRGPRRTPSRKEAMATVEEKTAGAADVLARVEEENVEFVRFWFTDILGALKSFAVGKEELAGAFEDGMGFDGSSITGFNRIEESDMIAMPDASTFKILPWRTGETHKVGPRLLRRPEAGRRALRGRPALRDAPCAGPREGHGLRPLLPGAGARVLPVQGRPGHGDPRQGRLLRPDHARRGVGLPPRRGLHAARARHPGGVHPPRGRPLAARDRHALRRGPDDGGQHA